jgi:hypothetical protein
MFQLNIGALPCVCAPLRFLDRFPMRLRRYLITNPKLLQYKFGSSYIKKNVVIERVIYIRTECHNGLREAGKKAPRRLTDFLTYMLRPCHA